ncbi:MAG: hypothetical protein AB7U35_06495 [Sphingobium sp.]
MTIDGGGVTAACCRHLLSLTGIDVRQTELSRAGVPAIMLSDAARALLRDCLSRPDLFEDNARITRRIVAWGGQDPVALAHEAVMLGTDDLGFQTDSVLPPGDKSDFTVRAAHPGPDDAVLRVGDLSAETHAVRLLRTDETDACWIEAVDNGWLFLIPAHGGDGWLLGIGAPTAQLLDESRHVRDRVAIDDRRKAVRFDTSPRMLEVMCGDGWLAGGSGSMGFDPICGDGTALAARQAILASAVITALRDGEDARHLLDHYQAIMTAALRRHLRLCSEFYATGGSSLWWLTHQRALAEGHALLSDRLNREPPPRFVLQGFGLVRREVAA